MNMSISTTTAALLCLTMNVYHEAGAEPLKGKAAVAHVTMNRAQTKDQVCRTIREPGQFSWVRSKSKAKVDKTSDAWKNSYIVAKNALSGTSRDPSKGATHFHASYVRPTWSKKLTLTTKIGRHLFYK